jgi:hypothetical protein
MSQLHPATTPLQGSLALLRLYYFIVEVEEDDIRLSFIYESSRHRSNRDRVTSFNSCNYCLSRWLRLVGLH